MTSVANQITWDELERKHKANQLKDWVLATFPDLTSASNKKTNNTNNTNITISNGITLEKVFTALIGGSIRSDNPFNGVMILRCILQHLPITRLHSLVIPEDLLKWLTSYANDRTTIKTIQRATVLSVIVQLLKGCSLLHNCRVIGYVTRILDFNLTAIYEELYGLLPSLPVTSDSGSIPSTASSLYVGNVMIIHQLEDLILIIGSTNQSIELINTWPIMTETGDATTTLSAPIKLLGHLTRIGTMRINSPHGDQFDLDICKIFAMLAEIVVSNQQSNNHAKRVMNILVNSVSSSKSSISSSSLLDDLIQGSERIIDIVLHGKVVHDSFLSAFHNAIEILTLVLNRIHADNDRRQLMISRVFTLYQRVVALIDEVTLENVVDAKRVEIFIGAISSFFEKISSESKSTTDDATPTMYNFFQDISSSVNDSASAIDIFIRGVSNLQTRMKDALVKQSSGNGSSTTSSTDQLKDFKIIFSDIRKGCISTVNHVFNLDQEWLTRSAANRKLFWDLALKQLSTPMLFSAAYRSALRNYPVYVKQMVEYLAKAMTMISNYSLTASEDILETIKQLLIDDCQELVLGGVNSIGSSSSSGQRYEVNIIPSLLYCLNHFPKSLTSANSQGQYKWKTTICLTLQEVYALLCRVDTSGVSGISSDSLINSTKSLLTTIFQEIIQEHIKANSLFTTSSCSKGKKKKMKEIDGSVDLFHAACTCYSTICDYLLIVRANSAGATIATGNWQDRLVCCLEGILKPLIFEDDLIDILLTSDLLSRLTVMFVQESSIESLQNNDLFIASLLALTVCGPIQKDDSISDRLLVTLKLFVTETLSSTSSASSNNKNMWFQASNILVGVTEQATECKEQNETMMMSANAGVGLVMEKIAMPLRQDSGNNTVESACMNRLQLLVRAFQALKQ